MVNVAINGFGRIGRMVFRAAFKDPKINIIAINDLTDTKTLAYLLQHDSLQGSFSEQVSFDEHNLIISNKKIQVLAEKDPTKLPWKRLNIDVVVESTGRFTQPEDTALHLQAGAKKVLLSAPSKCDKNVCPINTTTLVFGVNHHLYNPKVHTIISNASCTTNCVAPVLKVLEDSIGIKQCTFTTIHAYTADQNLVDGPHKDLRRARAAATNIIPTTSGADIAVVQAIPSLQNKVRGFAIRVPVASGSVTDFTIEVKKDTTSEEINSLLQKAASKGLKGIIQYSTDELVSSDIIHNPYSSIIDSKLTTVVNKRTVKIIAWYDNEWGYSCRMVDMIKLL